MAAATAAAIGPVVIAPAEPTVRALCPRCRRPSGYCYCAHVTPQPTQTRVVLLQHPRERRVAIGTARMAHLCLPNSELHVGMRWDDHPGLAAALAAAEGRAVLLYPGDDARDVLAEPLPPPVTLVVVDGTWSQAKTLVRDNPILARLPRVAFTAPRPSEYRIRREPSPEVVSTIEALAFVLGALEGDPARFEALRQPFRAMVDRQVEVIGQSANRRQRAPRTAHAPRWPLVVRDRWADLVLVMAEANAWPYRRAALPDPTTPRYPDELIQWVAVRVATGEVFALIVQPQHPLAPWTCAHTGLDEGALQDGLPRAEAVAAFAAWLRPDDVLASWGPNSTRLWQASGGAARPVLDIRGMAHHLAKRRTAGIDEFVASVALTPPSPPAPGRAGRRMAMLQAIAAYFRHPPAR